MNPIKQDNLSRNKRKRFSLLSLSIQQRLPLFICILLLTVIIAFSWISYISVKNASMGIGAERVTTLADKLSTMFQGSVDQFIASLQKVAGEKSVKDFLASGDARSGEQTLTLFKEFAKKDTSTRIISLLNGRKQEVLRSGMSGLPLKVNIDSLIVSKAGKVTYTGVGRFVLYKGSMYFPTLVPVTDGDKTVGYLVNWQLMHITQQAVDQFSQLLGGNGRIYFGNDDAGFWTDLVKPVEGPPANMDQLKKVAQYSRKDSGPQVGSMRAIPDSKWLLVVELSSASFTETADIFLRWVAIIGIFLVIAGSIGGWILMRNITGSIKRLSRAAVSVADGDYSIAVDVDRQDELGKLAESFNIMAERVRNTQQGLEQKVVETERELQTAIIDINQKEKSEKKKDEFISIASHELKTPLTTIKAFFQIAVKEMDPGFKSFNLIGRASRQLTRMERLIEDLLDASRINSGRMQYNLEDFDFHEILREAIDNVREIFPHHNLVIEKSAPVMFHGDKHRIEQVIINLVNNAVKYSPDADRVLIRSEVKDGKISVTIEDFGIGIAEEHINELFESFYRINVEQHFQGLGLGLFISSEIIKRHGGDIWVESEVGRGSAFTFQLPVAEEV